MIKQTACIMQKVSQADKNSDQSHGESSGNPVQHLQSIVHIESLLNRITLYLRQQTDNLPLIEHYPAEDLAQKLSLDLPEQPCSEQALSDFVEQYLRYSVNTNHHGFVNQLWSKTLPSSFLGEVLAAATNTSIYTYEVAPVATLLETEMIRWLTELVWSVSGDGIMTSGGTASNLHALLIARNNAHQDIKFRGIDQRRLAIFCSEDAHYSIKRAANILGFGMENVIEVKPGVDRSMDASGLCAAIDRSAARGLEPFCVVATAGTTVYGAYDKIGEIAAVSRQHKLWLHVDGALGASVLFSAEHKKLMQGVVQADSLTWDFHKMLGMHLPCAFLLVKQTGLMKAVISTANDDYLFHESNPLDLGNKSLQCGRQVDIIKLWLSWLVLGRQGFNDRVDKLFALARFASQYIDKNPDLVLVAPPISTNICFRFKRQKQKNMEVHVRDMMLRDGQYMLNYASDQDGTFFRLALTNADLSEHQLKAMIDKITLIGKDSDVD